MHVVHVRSRLWPPASFAPPFGSSLMIHGGSQATLFAPRSAFVCFVPCVKWLSGSSSRGVYRSKLDSLDALFRRMTSLYPLPHDACETSKGPHHLSRNSFGDRACRGQIPIVPVPIGIQRSSESQTAATVQPVPEATQSTPKTDPSTRIALTPAGSACDWAASDQDPLE